MTQVPWLDWLLRKNRIGDFLQRTFASQPSLTIVNFITKSIKERKERKDKANGDADSKPGREKDFLTRYIELEKNDPQIPHW